MTAVYDGRHHSTGRFVARITAWMMVAILISGTGGYLLRMVTAPRSTATTVAIPAIVPQPVGPSRGDAWYNEQASSAASDSQPVGPATRGDAWYNEPASFGPSRVPGPPLDNWWADTR